MNNENITINKLKRYKDRYVATYKLQKTNDYNHFIPLTIIKQDNNHYKFKFKYGEEETILFEGNIYIYNDCIALNYINNQNSLRGKNI